VEGCKPGVRARCHVKLNMGVVEAGVCGVRQACGRLGPGLRRGVGLGSLGGGGGGVPLLGIVCGVGVLGWPLIWPLGIPVGESGSPPP